MYDISVTSSRTNGIPAGRTNYNFLRKRPEEIPDPEPFNMSVRSIRKYEGWALSSEHRKYTTDKTVRRQEDLFS